MDLVRKTRFNIFQSQGDQRRLMQETTRKVLNRRIDADIIAQLDTASNNLGAATQISLATFAEAHATLGENEVDCSDVENMWAVLTPAANAYLMQIPEFSSADYVETKPLTGPTRRVARWAGFNIIVHPNLTGVGTSSENCFFYHRDSIGSAFDSGEGLNTAIGYDDEQDYSYSRASSFTGAVILQQTGLLLFRHDASGI